MARAVGYAGLSDLAIGQTVLYKAGRGKHRVEAVAAVAKAPGTTGVFVKLNTITRKGGKAKAEAGQEILAGAKELFYP